MSTQLIDLHGLKHEDVKRELIKKIEKHWDQNCDIKVVTGHSKQMRAIAMEVIEEYRLDWEEGLHPAYLRILG